MQSKKYFSSYVWLHFVKASLVWLIIQKNFIDLVALKLDLICISLIQKISTCKTLRVKETVAGSKVTKDYAFIDWNSYFRISKSQEFVAINHSLNGTFVPWLFGRIIFKVVEFINFFIIEGYNESLFLHPQVLAINSWVIAGKQCTLGFNYKHEVGMSIYKLMKVFVTALTKIIQLLTICNLFIHMILNACN